MSDTSILVTSGVGVPTGRVVTLMSKTSVLERVGVGISATTVWISATTVSVTSGMSAAVTTTTEDIVRSGKVMIILCLAGLSRDLGQRRLGGVGIGRITHGQSTLSEVAISTSGRMGNRCVGDFLGLTYFTQMPRKEVA
jgi:hypothetical protein